MLRALGRPPGVEHVYVTGAAAIQHDLDPVFNADLRHGELMIALPVALLVLLAVFGFSFAVTIPLLFAACTITGTLGIVYGVAHLAVTPTYATNLVELIGLGIAVDYSLLVVYRFREELAAGTRASTRRSSRTMQTAGRAVIFSGVAVALGLALLVAMPLPFIRMLGVAGFLIPIVSILGAATLQPVLLSYYGAPRHRPPAPPPGAPGRASTGSGRGSPARSWRRPCGLPRRRRRAAARSGGAGLLHPGNARLELRDPAQLAVGARLRPPDRGGRTGRRSRPPRSWSRRRAGSVLAPATQAAIGRLVVAAARRPRGRRRSSAGRGSHFVEPDRRDEQVIVAGRHDYGFPQAQAFVGRLRGTLIPAAALPRGRERCSSAARRPRESTSSTRPTATSCR